tara:strand:- start:583 stop:735 length:153 start_codon:yes stop_codon:yes gene_type:complete
MISKERLIASQQSKKESILPLGHTDNAVVEKNISKNEVIKLSWCSKRISI